MTRRRELIGADRLRSTDVHDVILRHVTDGGRAAAAGLQESAAAGLHADLAALAAHGDWPAALARIVERLSADSGTLHLMGADGALHLAAASPGIPPVVREAVRIVPVGKGMAGLAVERRQPVNACNIQTDATGDVRPGARATGLQGSVVVPLLRGGDAVGALGVATRSERTFTGEEEQLLIALGRILAAVEAAEGARTKP
jgi:GAF domain-containing protein